MTKVLEIRDVHSIVQRIIDKIEADPEDHIQYDKPSMSQGMGIAGHSDFRILYRGIWIDVEGKADMWLDYPRKLSANKTKLPTAAQCKQLERTEKAGGIALVVDIHTAHKIYDLLQAIKYRFHQGSSIKADDFQHLCSAMHWKQFSRKIQEVEL